MKQLKYVERYHIEHFKEIERMKKIRSFLNGFLFGVKSVLSILALFTLFIAVAAVEINPAVCLILILSSFLFLAYVCSGEDADEEG